MDAVGEEITDFCKILAINARSGNGRREQARSSFNGKGN